MDKAVMHKRAFLDTFYKQRFNEKRLQNAFERKENMSHYNTSGTAETVSALSSAISPHSQHKRMRSSFGATQTPHTHNILIQGSTRPTTRQIQRLLGQ